MVAGWGVQGAAHMADAGAAQAAASDLAALAAEADVAVPAG